jgi:hypothetical protein
MTFNFTIAEFPHQKVETGSMLDCGLDCIRGRQPSWLPR